MAIVPAAYATESEYRAVIGMTDTGNAAQINADLETISRYIDGRLGRHFGKDDVDVTRTYEVKETREYIWIDDVVSIVSVAVDGRVLDAQDYELLPLNADKGPEPRPYTRLRLKKGVFWEGARVEITGRFGWPDVPNPIKAATIQLTAILRLETPRATRRIPELGDAIEASPDAQRIIRDLMDAYQRVRYA